MLPREPFRFQLKFPAAFVPGAPAPCARSALQMKCNLQRLQSPRSPIAGSSYLDLPQITRVFPRRRCCHHGGVSGRGMPQSEDL